MSSKYFDIGYEIGLGFSLSDVHVEELVGVHDCDTVEELQSAIISELCDAEANAHSFSPFEFLAKEINESDDPEDNWEDYDTGVYEAIESVVGKADTGLLARIVVANRLFNEEVHPLQDAVIAQLGYNAPEEEVVGILLDIARYGIDGGYGGFIYYTDTIAFFNRHERAIEEALEDDATSFGYDNYLAMLAEVPKNPPTNIDEIKNMASWWTAESVARVVESLYDEVI